MSIKLVTKYQRNIPLVKCILLIVPLWLHMYMTCMIHQSKSTLYLLNLWRKSDDRRIYPALCTYIHTLSLSLSLSLYLSLSLSPGPGTRLQRIYPALCTYIHTLSLSLSLSRTRYKTTSSWCWFFIAVGCFYIWCM